MSEIHARRIDDLKKLLAECEADYYIVPTADCHGSEYVSDHFKMREYLSGFTGSNGTLLVMRDKALLWTDGRYFIQAAGELEGSGIDLMKMDAEGVPTLLEYVKEHVQKGQCIAFDGQVVSCLLGKKLEKLACEKQARIMCERDLAAPLWKDRPALPGQKIMLLPGEFTGQNTQEKILNVRKKMEKAGAGLHVLTKLDDIMWLFNIRGRDIPCNPVALSYAILTGENAYLFLQREAVTAEAEDYLKSCDVTLKYYDEFYEILRSLLVAENSTEREAAATEAESGDADPGKRKVLLDEREINFSLYRLADEHGQIVWEENPTTALKAVKNETELMHMRNIFVRDSVAVIRFIRHMKLRMAEQNPFSRKSEPPVDEKTLTETYAANYIDNLRKHTEGFLDLSFETISAYKENAAMMHYTADEGSDKALKPEGFLLVDSGGQYMGGTTDVTRTIALGDLTEEEKRDFTLVAVGMLRLMNVRFLYGCTGRNLDIIAREPLWRIGRDYKCGTGHGVGYILNVHEGPHRIGFSYQRDNVEAKLEPGMVVTDEPGVYVEGSHGIRTENVMVCRKAEKTPDGQFLCFEPLTFAPIDLEAIEPAYMTAEDKKLLNDYHRAVYEKTAPYLDEEERQWLRQQTREI